MPGGIVMSRYWAILGIAPPVYWREFPSGIFDFAGARFPGAYSAGVTPLPIPNRAVKPRSADGTALRGGRVGRCQDSFREALSSTDDRASFFVVS